MRRETHLAALRMASKVALSTALSTVSACSSTAPAPITATPAAESVPQKPAPAPPPPLSCEQRIEQAFPTEGHYPGEKQNVSPEVVSCCRESLLAHHGGAPHRWDCCANVEKTGNDLHAACTPWGPPMPPSVSGVAAGVAQNEAHPREVLDLREAARAIELQLPTIPALRSAAIETWRGRMVNEYASSEVFAALGRQLEELGLGHANWAREIFAFADEERRHGVLCGAVVESLGGDARAELPAVAELPLHPDAHTPLEAALRNVLSVCCLSETVAVGLIGAERVEMPDGALRTLLTTIWSDEVGHARFGWRLLAEVAPSLDAATRARLADYLEVAFAHLVEHELAHLPLSSEPPEEGVMYGLCSGRDARALFYDVVETVIVPGLEAHGVPARRAWLDACS